MRVNQGVFFGFAECVLARWIFVMLKPLLGLVGARLVHGCGDVPGPFV